MAKRNLRVNGRNFEDLDEDEQGVFAYSRPPVLDLNSWIGGLLPFDEALDRHIWSLSDQSLKWDGEIARKRRERPQDVERLVRELIEARQTVDAEELTEFEHDVVERLGINVLPQNDEDIPGVLL
jgi:hypothetical protein